MKFSILIQFCLMFLYGFEFANGDRQSVAVEKDENIIIYHRYLEMDKQLKKVVDQGIKYALPYVMKANEHINISSKCMKNIMTLTGGVRNLKLWALRFLDATGKLSDGVLSYNMHMLGDFDLCLNSSALKKNGDIDFRGQYCTVFYKPILPKKEKTLRGKSNFEAFINATRNASDIIRFIATRAQLMEIIPFKFGLCVPSGCSKQDIEQAVEYFGEKIMLNASVEHCQVEGSFPVLNKRSIVIICIFVTIGMLGIIAAIVENCLKRKDNASRSTFTNILICFSVTRNFTKVMNTKTSETTLSCIHGIRVLSLFWIILEHEYLFHAINYIGKHANHVPQLIQQWYTQILINGFVVVDVFFCMGGLLHSYLRMRKESSEAENSLKQNVGIIQILILRIWRLSPIYICSILLAYITIPRGPMVPLYQKYVLENCEKNWWQNVLFIHNFFKPDDMCFQHAWYVSADMQLFLISLFSVSLLIRNPTKGIILNVGLLVLGIIITAVWCYIKDIPPVVLLLETPLTFSNVTLENIRRLYFSPFAHAAPYFTGILLGYILATKKGMKIPKVYQFIGWPVAAITFTSLLFVVKKWNSGVEFTRLESSLYFSFSRFLIPLCVCWMILCCATGSGGIINYILTMKLWVPLSRISYAAYFVSIIIQLFYSLNQRSSPDIHNMLLIWQYFGDIVVNCLLSLLLVVLVESPSIALQKLFLQRILRKADISAKPTEENGNSVFKTNVSILEYNEKNITRF